MFRAALRLNFLILTGPALDQQEEKWDAFHVTEEEPKQVETTTVI